MRFIPSVTRSRCTDAKVAYGLMAAARSGGKPFRAESSSNEFERIQPENLVTACHSLEEHPATETSDWREIRRKKRGATYMTKRNFDAPSVSRSFLFLPKVRC
ncbi:hypothetical protein [Bacteroides cellulosilyticus]|uniref:hypothetical protein n=1 Tax=Bacteroides cellulosilyticus TaxID=246787 RepID=UPI0032EE2FD6